MADLIVGFAVLGAFLLIPFGFAAWAASLAEKRGRAPVPHGLLGLFFGPIGVLIAALRAPDHVALANRPVPQPRHYSRRGNL